MMFMTGSTTLSTTIILKAVKYINNVLSRKNVAWHGMAYISCSVQNKIGSDINAMSGY